MRTYCPVASRRTARLCDASAAGSPSARLGPIGVPLVLPSSAWYSQYGSVAPRPAACGPDPAASPRSALPLAAAAASGVAPPASTVPVGASVEPAASFPGVVPAAPATSGPASVRDPLAPAAPPAPAPPVVTVEPA